MIEIEKELTEGMHAALADEPPLGFDPDEVADRAGRLRRRRHLAYATAASAATATAVLAAVAVVVGNRDDAGRDVGTPTASPTTEAPAEPAACQDIPPIENPPMHFPGSKQLVLRLYRDMPDAIAEHLHVDAVKQSHKIYAMDCPPRLTSGYVFGDDVAIGLYLSHARPGIDDEGDPYTGIPNVRVIHEYTAEDGALIRVYEITNGKDGSEIVRGSEEDPLIVVRLGTDGMVGKATIYPRMVAIEDVVALLGDPRLHFPIPH